MLIENKENEKKLYFASKDGNTEAVKRLIAILMVDVNFVVPWGWAPRNQPPIIRATPLYWAVFHDHIDVVKLLIDAGAEVDKIEKVRGFTPLHLAAKKDQKEVFKLLLDGGARVDTENIRKNTPLHGLPLMATLIL